MKMRKTITALVALALCIGVFGIAEAKDPRPRTKQVKWVVWGPTGPAGTPSDTSQTLFDGANDVDTTEAINLSDMAWDVFVPKAGAASVVQGGLKVWIVSDGSVDDIDSLYYAIESSPDGNHWNRQTGLIAAGSVGWKGVLAGNDQGGSIIDVAGNCLSFTVVYDADDADGVKATQVAGLGNWYLAPFVRLHILTDDTSTNVIRSPRVFVTYLANIE